MWTRKHIDVEMINGRMQAYCGVRTINICIDSGNLANVEVLVVCDKLLGIDLLAGIDALTALCGTFITQWTAGVVSSLLCNRVLESLIYKDISDVYEQEFLLQIGNGWLILYHHR